MVSYVVGMGRCRRRAAVSVVTGLRLKSMAEQCRPPENVVCDCDRREETLAA